MHNITFISTIHQESGKCNAEELYKIIERLSPEVIFLEAFYETYSESEEYSFSTWGQYHEKLEIAAIQKYSSNTSVEYVTVCENSLSDALKRKNKILRGNRELQRMVENLKYLAAENGFTFLNSLESINLLEEVRVLENRVLGRSEAEKWEAAIDAYENPMIQNIYSYCNNNHFSSAIFMCGAAHRKSIIEKMKEFNDQEEKSLNWEIFGR